MVRILSGLVVALGLMVAPSVSNSSSSNLAVAATPDCLWWYGDCYVEVYIEGDFWQLEIDCEDGSGGVWTGESGWGGKCP